MNFTRVILFLTLIFCGPLTFALIPFNPDFCGLAAEIVEENCEVFSNEAERFEQCLVEEMEGQDFIYKSDFFVGSDDTIYCLPNLPF